MPCEAIVDQQLLQSDLPDIDSIWGSDNDFNRSAYAQAGWLTPASPQYKLCGTKFYLTRTGDFDVQLQAWLMEVENVGGLWQPTGVPLAISNNVNASTLPLWGTIDWILFTFPEPYYTMQTNHRYAIVLVAISGSFDGNLVGIGVYAEDIHEGNSCTFYESSSTWDLKTHYDMTYIVLGEEILGDGNGDPNGNGDTNGNGVKSFFSINQEFLEDIEKLYR